MPWPLLKLLKLGDLGGKFTSYLSVLVLLILLTLVIASDYLQAVRWLGEDWIVPKVLFIFSVSVLLVLARNKIRPYPRNTSSLLILWIGFALATLTSTMLLGPNRAPALWYLVGIPLLVFNMMPVLLGRRGNFLIACSLVLTSAFFIIWSLIMEPMYFGPQQYTGVFQGTPTMSAVAALMVIGSLTLLGGVVAQPRVKQAAVVILSLLLFFGFVVVISTAYRTVIASCLVMVIVFVGARLRQGRNLLRIVGLMSVLLIVLIAGVVVSGRGEQLRFWEAALYKQKDKTTGRVGGVWSYRDTEWRFMLTHASLLGHGLNFAKKAPTTQSYHSSFTLVLGSYGIIAALFFAGFWFTALYFSYRYLLRTGKSDPYNLLPLLGTIFFLFHSMGAVLLTTWATGAIFAILLSLGTVIMQEAVQYQQGTQSTPPPTSAG
jgi:hypothetical protein